ILATCRPARVRDGARTCGDRGSHAERMVQALDQSLMPISRDSPRPQRTREATRLTAMTARSHCVIVLSCVSALLGGCATWPAPSREPATAGSSASPASSTPALPPNAFGPEPSHYFGTGGP